MPELPIDLIVNILSRLPVKPLLRFRCVSKPFCALIDSLYFIKSHLKQSIETKTHLSLILRNSNLYSLDLDSLNNKYNVVELDHPFKPYNWATEVLGSCDGLLCLCNGEEHIAIWNPSTRRHQKVPFEEIEYPDYFSCCQYMICYGFGYDPVTDDYKLVRLIQFGGVNDWDSFALEVKVHVYSMKSNSWRRILDFPYYLDAKWCYGMLVGSALHWVVSRNYFESDTANLIAAFDLSTEEYLLVPQPEFSSKDFHMNISELEGCLCILCNYIGERVDVWVMKDYGVKESWMKLFSIAQPEMIRSFEFVIPLVYSKGGRDVLLVQDNKKLVWLDVERKKFKKIKASDIANYFVSFVSVESLVPLSGGGEIYGKNHDGKGKKMKKMKKKSTPKKTYPEEPRCTET